MKTLVKIGGRKSIEPSGLILVQSDSNYTRLFMQDGRKLFVATTLKVLQERLLGFDFMIRPNRGHLINRNYIERVDFMNENVFMPNYKPIRISRRRKLDFFNLLNINN